MPRKPHSEETKQKMRLAALGRKRSPETIEKMRAATLGKKLRLGAKHSEETKQKLREIRAAQVSPKLAARGITQEQINEAEAAGLRWCSGSCKAFIAAEEFAGKYAKCRKCIAGGVAKVRAEWTEQEREENAEYLSKWRIENADKVRRKWLLKKYGVTPEWYEQKLQEQDGHCALCEAIIDGRKLAATCIVPRREYLLVDHDHETGRARGLLCAKCNTALHRVEYIKDWAALALAYLARYRS